MPKSAKKTSASTARFAKVVADCGTPELVVLWGEPTKSFLAADKQDRVMTVLQPVVGSQKDYGLVGFQPGKSASYLAAKCRIDFRCFSSSVSFAASLDFNSAYRCKSL